jgi:hypothetical protein
MNNIHPIWLRYAIIYGLASILMSLIFYYAVTIGMGKQSIISFILMIIFMVLSGKAERQSNGDVLSYGEALKTTFLTGFIGLAISGLFAMILMNLIDPSLTEKLTEQALEMTRSMMESFGMPEDQIEEAIEKAEEQTSQAFTPLKQIIGILQSSIFALIIAAIVSIFIKKDEDIHKIDINSLGNPS